MNLYKKSAIGFLTLVGLSTGFIAEDKLGKYEEPETITQEEIEIIESDNRQFLKSKRLSAIKIKKFFKKEGEFNKRGFDIKILKLNIKGEDLSVTIEAYKDGEKLTIDNPYIYVNPPVKVFTGKYHKELLEGKEIDVENFEYNPEEALMEIITQTIEYEYPNLKE